MKGVIVTSDLVFFLSIIVIFQVAALTVIKTLKR
jgi:hypothetical protein